LKEVIKNLEEVALVEVEEEVVEWEEEV